MVSRLPSASGSRWMSAATGDWPGWPPVKVAKRPEQQGLERKELVHMASQKGTWGVSPGQERWRLRTGILLSLTEGTRSLGFPVNHPRSAWACLIITEI